MSDNSGSYRRYDRRLVLKWIHFMAQHVLPEVGLVLEGEVWYQGKPASMPDCVSAACVHTSKLLMKL